MHTEMIKGACIFTAVTAALVCQASEWGTNYEAALEQARQKGKSVLAEFTGSDWCYYCTRLKADVLENPEFAAWAAENFVLLEVDVPENPRFSLQQLAQNQMLCTKYKIDGFPTLLVLDAQGRPLGGLIGYESDAAAVRQALEKGLSVDRLLRQAAAQQGEEKLQSMLAAWRLLPKELHELNIPLQQELAAIDPQDLSGLRAAADARKNLENCWAAEKAAPTDAAALEIVDAALAKSVPANRRDLLELKYRLLILMAETPEDVYAAAEVAYATVDADLRLSPEAKELHKKQLRGVFANPQTALNRSRMIKRRRPKR